MPSTSSNNKILTRMLERLFATIANGPSLNARPHSSRQRVDLVTITRFNDLLPEDALRTLLGETRSVKLKANVAMPPNLDVEDADDQRSEEERANQKRWSDQQSLLHKLRIIAEDAKTYEQDTGVHVLHLGFPLLSLPPGAVGGSSRQGVARRVLAPVAFVPVSISVQRGATQGVEIACKGEGTDLVMPNTALIAWLEQQTGKTAEEIFSDEEGSDPWREIRELVGHVCKTLEIAPPTWIAPPIETEGGKTDSAPAPELKLAPAPKADETATTPTLLPTAILGLFPMTNQGLLRDMQAMVAGEEPLAGPVESFIRSDVNLDAPAPIAAPQTEAPATPQRSRSFVDERLVSAADPCQSRAVKLARESKGLVIHGPPGTGKSQTITNIVGDHLSRGQRVLIVCDKRTALDVVANRLEHMGLGKLCALVHDPQRDQRDLYRAIREQLDELPETQSDARAEKKLAKIDEELQSLHAELTRHHVALMSVDEQTGLCFHALVGQWLAEPADDAVHLDPATIATATPAEIDKHDQDVRDILQRAVDVEFATNPWRDAVGIALQDFLARPMDEFRAAMSGCVSAARDADATAHPSIPSIPPSVDLARVGAARTDLAARLAKLMETGDPIVLARWSRQKPELVTRASKRLAEHETFLQTFRAGSLDAELSLAVRGGATSQAEISEHLATLASYLEVARKWTAFIAIGKKSAAAKVLNRFGLTLSPESAERVRNFLAGLRARLVLQSLNEELRGDSPSATPLLADDETIETAMTTFASLFSILSSVQSDPLHAGLAGPVVQALSDRTAAQTLLNGLERSPARCAALAKLEASLAQTRLFNAEWLAAFAKESRGGKLAAEAVDALVAKLGTVEGVIRAKAGIARLPDSLRAAATQLVEQSVEPAAGRCVLRRGVFGAEIARRLRGDPQLQGIDGQRAKSSFDRYRTLEAEKKEAVRGSVLHRWISRQKERLLATTGSRLNSAGADVKRRLTMRGERAMRLRQVIQVGAKTEGGDPLFDLRPIWMASPETVAQVFPRNPAPFDVVVFDEASQCRLEEALPVLLRGQRVVIAGDPKQLPPTRFFESTIATSDDDGEIETDQQLFEQQQGEIEDLLGAALNLSIQQCYLDVHYRSRNADLIEFSNEYFYNKRLQAIPGHPNNRSRFAPLTLYRVGGTYKESCNEAEADQVCKIVRDLLKRGDPPSIGIACFNIDQRDLIVEKLDAMAAEDAEFGKKLAAARTRQGEGSFEGLFVKNLENVQGDERDHMIISTTYGPDEKGRFYRRFGPLGRAGGGRRLNVLVTRAREEVHLVTSIPAEAYRALPPIPPGQAAGGGWLLFAYLHYAEKLAEEYETANRILKQAEADASAASTSTSSPAPAVNVRPSRWPSMFSQALAERLASAHRIGSDVYWGNDGFCVDVALRHPLRAEDVTVGVICDSSRFAQAEDPVEWDIFRTAIHESQGWTLHRLWTPHFFRDPSGIAQNIATEAAEMVAAEKPKDGLPVSRSRAKKTP